MKWHLQYILLKSSFSQKNEKTTTFILFAGSFNVKPFTESRIWCPFRLYKKAKKYIVENLNVYVSVCDINATVLPPLVNSRNRKKGPFGSKLKIIVYYYTRKQNLFCLAILHLNINRCLEIWSFKLKSTKYLNRTFLKNSFHIFFFSKTGKK